MFWSIVWSKSDNQNLNSSGAVFCFVHCLIYKVQSLASFSLAWGSTYSIISHSLAFVKGFLEFFQLFQLSEFRFIWFLLAFMTNRVSCFCLPFPVGVQRNVVYYITSFSVCQGVLEASFDFLFREPIPFPNRLGSALPKDQLTSSRCSAQRHLLYHIQLLLSRGFWKIFWRFLRLLPEHQRYSNDGCWDYFMPKRFLNLSTRPPVSTSFCLPVKKGWHFEQISTCIWERQKNIVWIQHIIIWNW